MPDSLLATKLHIPPVRPDTLNRPRLFDILENAVNASVTLVAAPAEFGKSTLVAGWLAQGSRRAAWLSLDERDNDPMRFWQYVMAALQGIDPASGIIAANATGSNGVHRAIHRQPSIYSGLSDRGITWFAAR